MAIEKNKTQKMGKNLCLCWRFDPPSQKETKFKWCY